MSRDRMPRRRRQAQEVFSPRGIVFKGLGLIQQRTAEERTAPAIRATKDRTSRRRVILIYIGSGRAVATATEDKPAAKKTEPSQVLIREREGSPKLGAWPDLRKSPLSAVRAFTVRRRRRRGRGRHAIRRVPLSALPSDPITVGEVAARGGVPAPARPGPPVPAAQIPDRGNWGAAPIGVGGFSPRPRSARGLLSRPRHVASPATSWWTGPGRAGVGWGGGCGGLSALAGAGGPRVR